MRFASLTNSQHEIRAEIKGTTMTTTHNTVLSDQDVGKLTVFDGLMHVETPLLAEYIRHIESEILAKQAAQQEPVARQYLLNGTRFKMSFFDDGDDSEYGGSIHVKCFNNFEKELSGRWVALVAAEDDGHLHTVQPTTPAQDKLVEAAEKAYDVLELVEPNHPITEQLSSAIGQYKQAQTLVHPLSSTSDALANDLPPL
jgi:hypothetical protein